MAQVVVGIKYDWPSSQAKLQKAWFLDVASPTWEDLRAIGKVRRILNLQAVLTSSIAFTSTSSHFGRHSTTRPPRKT